jgi:hypothetical protein
MIPCERPLDSLAQFQLWARHCPVLLSCLAFALLSPYSEKLSMDIPGRQAEMKDPEHVMKAQAALGILSLIPRPRPFDLCLSRFCLAFITNTEQVICSDWDNFLLMFYHSCTFSLALGVVGLEDIFSMCATQSGFPDTDRQQARASASQYFSLLKLEDQWDTHPAVAVELD